jgi:hypothetical protein
MMTEGTATPWSLWIETEARPPRRWGNLAITLAAGVLLGTALAAGAADRIYDAFGPREIAPARAGEVRELPPEWRATIRPAPYDRMFMKRS